MSVVEIAPVVAPVAVGRSNRLIISSTRLWRTRIGGLLTLLLIGVAILGPYLAPHDPNAFAGAPFAKAGDGLVLGTDQLGHDVLSRFLAGGRQILILSALSTAIGVSLGALVGLAAAYSRGWLDEVLMRTMDVMLAIPQIIVALIVMTTVGPASWLIVATVGITTMPRVARVLRGAAVSIVERDFVASAEALGEPRLRILAAEILPNVTGPLVVETTLRLTYSIGLIASLAFLGFTPDPTAPDWGLMIHENVTALTIQPWGTLTPVIAIGLLTLGTGLIGDGLARASSGIDRNKAET
jgi:peptide/nickel transport system permease protein